MMASMGGVVVDVEMVTSVGYWGGFVSIIICSVGRFLRSNCSGRCSCYWSIIQFIKNNFVLCDKK
jgi:hypothetical protein